MNDKAFDGVLSTFVRTFEKVFSKPDSPLSKADAFKS